MSDGVSSGKKRAVRSTNMSASERLLLVDLCAKYSQIIDCKKTDSGSWKAKGRRGSSWLPSFRRRVESVASGVSSNTYVLVV